MSEGNSVSVRPTTQLDFYQAMKDFTTMFPEMERDVIEEVLRANHGAVDATIDQLLAMSTDNQNEVLRLDLEKSDPPDVTKHGGDGLSDVTGRGGRSPLRTARGWAPPLVGPLPSSFLRLAVNPQQTSVECVEDERIALFLQNEEFLSELRINQEFLSTLDDDMGERTDAEAFRERLRHMGKISRNKFSQLARVFQRRKKSRSSKALVDDASAGDAMLLPKTSQDESLHQP